MCIFSFVNLEYRFLKQLLSLPPKQVDLVKLDGCFSNWSTFDENYPQFGRHIIKTGRPMLYSCSWPAYQQRWIVPNYTAIAEHCNIWRNYIDIQDSFQSMSEILAWFGNNANSLRKFASPGAWHDADMLIIGDFGLTIGQAQAQFALWAILASPLLVSADLRSIRPEFRSILLNREIIAISQDRLGLMGARLHGIQSGDGVEIWRRPVLPIFYDRRDTLTYGSFAVACWNRRPDGTPFVFQRRLRHYGLNHTDGYYMRDLYLGVELGRYWPDDWLTVSINPSGSVVMLRALLAITTSERQRRRLREAARRTWAVARGDFRQEHSGYALSLPLALVVITLLVYAMYCRRSGARPLRCVYRTLCLGRRFNWLAI